MQKSTNALMYNCVNVINFLNIDIKQQIKYETERRIQISTMEFKYVRVDSKNIAKSLFSFTQTYSGNTPSIDL